LKTDYKEDMSLNEALIMAAKVLAKSMDTVTPNENKFEIGVITKDENGNIH
jgi:20S proteasome subunit alpha 3